MDRILRAGRARIGIGAAVVLVAIAVGWFVLRRRHPPLPFEQRPVSRLSGDCKSAGDIDGDGMPDVVIGGQAPAEPLTWYRYPDWAPTLIATARQEWSNESEMADVDGDGDLDIVIPDATVKPTNLFWLENPRPKGDPRDGGKWREHAIGQTVAWCKDVETADFDGDGRLDVAARPEGSEPVKVFFQEADGAWTAVALPGLTQAKEGMASGDIDGDGDRDLVLAGTWVENPGGAAARAARGWKEHVIGALPYADFKALVADMDGDGRADVVFSDSETAGEVALWRRETSGGRAMASETPGATSATSGATAPAAPDTDDPWVKTVVDPLVAEAHTLLAGDVDLDGQMDLVVSSMERRALYAYLGDKGGRAWRRETIGRGEVHNGVLVDLGNDGDWDVFGASFTERVDKAFVWVNRLDPPGGALRFLYLPIARAHVRTFGLAFSDVDHDGAIDIASGPFWYRNPGRAKIAGPWRQSAPMPRGIHAVAALDVDHDDRCDLVGQITEGGRLAFYWLEGEEPQGSAFTATAIGTVEKASHELGAQGFVVADLAPGRRPAFAATSGGGLYVFEVPSAGAGEWKRVLVSANPSDEGVDAADLDGDGDLDLAATTGESKRVEWYENPDAAGAPWIAHVVGDLSGAAFPDRIHIADLDGDGRRDIVATEENGEASGARTIWWRAPRDPRREAWTPALIATLGSTNSLDVADVDGDGALDVIVAEQEGALRVIAFLNEHGVFRPRVVDRGKESHLGARAVDLDGDGAPDLVSIAYDRPGAIHGWLSSRPAAVRP